MHLIDTHVHINFEQYDADRDAMMQRAYDAGVHKMLHSCCNTREMQELLDYCLQYQGEGKTDLYMGVGVHPTEIESWADDSIATMREFLDANLGSGRIKAIGETGLDHYHVTDAEGKVRQEEIFREHIKLAQDYKLPLIVHTRDAWEDTLRVIQDCFVEDNEARSGTIHCYTGDLDFALECISRGFYISWSGVVTFKSSTDLREVAKHLPLERTLVETDCPFLAPQQRRGDRNEPSYVNFVADVLSECYEIDRDELAKITTANAEKLFGI